MRQVAGCFVYRYSKTSSIKIKEGCISVIKARGNEYEAQIVAVSESHIEIAIRIFLGPTLDRATLTNPRIQIFRKVLDKLRGDAVQRTMAEKVLRSDLSSLVHEGNAFDYHLEPENLPVKFQSAAVVNSIRNPLAVTVGNKGYRRWCGIAHTIVEHLRHGHRILLIAQENEALDAILNELLDCVSDNYRQLGKIFRLGVPFDQDLADRHPEVFLETVIRDSNPVALTEWAEVIYELADLLKEFDEKSKWFGILDEIRELNLIIKGTNDYISRQDEPFYAEIRMAEEHYKKIRDGSEASRLYTKHRDVRDAIIRLEQLRRTSAANSKKQFISYKELCDALERLNVSLKQLSEEWRSLNSVHGANFTELILEAHGRFLEKRFELENRTNHLEFQFRSSASKYLGEACVVAATTSELFAGTILDSEIFDVVIVEDAGIIPLPMLFGAFAKAKSAVTIFGAPTQSELVCQSRSSVAEKWLSRNIFEFLDIDNIEKARQSPLVSLLENLPGSDIFSNVSIYDQRDFRAMFLDDMSTAVDSIVLVCPYLTETRFNSYKNKFQALIKRGISFKHYTKPLEEQKDHMQVQAAIVQPKLREIGVEVFEISGLHQKIAIIDDLIYWTGSLNILSCTELTLEQMMRLHGTQCVDIAKQKLTFLTSVSAP